MPKPIELARWFGVALLTASALRVSTARACGVSASGVSSCSLEEHNEALRPRWAVGVSGVYTSTRLRFNGGIHADETRYASLATLAYLPTPKLVLQVGAGAAFGGSLRPADGEHAFSPGPTAALELDYRAFDDGRYFVLLTSSLSFASARTQRDREPTLAYTAFDLRIGAQAGLQVANLLRPYAVVRAFGGPVYWHYLGQPVTGTDTHHYQLGAGLGLRLAKSLGVFAEGVPFGERAVSLGAGVAF